MNVRRVLVVGLIASIVMGMIEMMYEAVAGAGCAGRPGGRGKAQRGGLVPGPQY